MVRIMSPLELDSIISVAYLEGRSHFGELGLELPAYRARIHSILKKNLGASPKTCEAAVFVKSLHGRDLYLATACAQHSPGHHGNGAQNGHTEDGGIAWKILESTYKGFVCDLVRFFYRPGFVSQDLADNIIADLFLPDRSGVSRIASYDGRSSLSTWLSVIVCNRSINAQRCCANAKSTDVQPDLPDAPALQSIEMTLLARRYQDALSDALGSACSRLSPRERLILLWRYEDGLQLGQIAKLLGIHQSNVTRQLERMLGKLRDDVIAILSRKHGLSQPAIEECLEEITENPQHDISIIDFIKNSAQPVRKQYVSLEINPAICRPPGSHKDDMNMDVPKGA